jgi:predicted pyridoxine 5'-phosphate oxidase superfamily flavin-nucleotide-binding protein
VKILGEEQIGFADYAGNKQFITRGNLETETKVSLFLMDYPRKARLKLLGRARMVDAKDDPKLAARLFQDGAAPAERLVVIDVAAVDWNCPKYIEPRYSESEIAAMIGPRLAALEEENELLRKQLAAFKANQT